MSKRISQKQFVLNYLKTSKHGITAMDAEKQGIHRLSGIIFNLRKEGYNIESLECRVNNRFGGVSKFSRYILNQEEKEQND